jgi:hypothetical protein
LRHFTALIAIRIIKTKAIKPVTNGKIKNKNGSISIKMSDKKNEMPMYKANCIITLSATFHIGADVLDIDLN